ncbi:SH3 domain-containing protein [Lewinella sp. LCG006]|uniref:SH3 domain-containing protein n=1 Tax=Lewinella sp. LCG006 TaxID=3231911 RepID=UPI003460610A
MRTALLTIIIISAHFLFGQYDEAFSTVTAPSGLTLREGPGLDYDRLTTIPFNTQVNLMEDQINYQQVDTIGDISGYWVPVRYQKKEGYLFSPYLKRGYLFTPANDGVNKDYRIVIPGMRVSALNYAPDLYWYALIAKAGEEYGDFLLQKVDPIVDFAPMTMEEHYNWAYEEGLVSMDLEVSDDYVFLFIGTQKPIEEVEKMVQKTYYNEAAGYPDWGQSIYPYQQLPIFEDKDGGRFVLSGHIAPTKSTYQSGDEIDYSLGISYCRYPGDYQQVPHQVLTPELSTSTVEEALPSYFYHHPRIFWQGDLNGDQMPDLIFYQPNTSECCGGSESFYLLMSEQINGNWEWHRAAEDTLESWGGC